MANEKTFEQVMKEFEEQQKAISEGNSLEWFLKQIRDAAKLEVTDGTNAPKAQKTEADAGPESSDTSTTSGQPGQSEREKVREEIKGKTARSTTNTADASKIGSLLFFTYDPKTKEKLKYWDMFPLVFPVIYKPDGFIGLNMHYLPPYYRALLFTQLLTLRNTREMDVMTFLNISYNTIKNVGRFAPYKPTIKRYLARHVRSQFIVVNPIHWRHVIMMPSALWQKQDEVIVWQDSIAQIQRTSTWGQGGRKSKP